MSADLRLNGSPVAAAPGFLLVMIAPGKSVISLNKMPKNLDEQQALLDLLQLAKKKLKREIEKHAIPERSGLNIYLRG